MWNMQFLHKFVKTLSAYINVATTSALEAESASSGENEIHLEPTVYLPMNNKLANLPCKNSNKNNSQLCDKMKSKSSSKSQYLESEAAHLKVERESDEDKLDPVEVTVEAARLVRKWLLVNILESNYKRCYSQIEQKRRDK